MSGAERSSGTLYGGLPYNRVGSGPRTAVAFTGLMFEHKPLSGPMAAIMTGLYKFLEPRYTVYVVNRRAGLAAGATLKDMADDYAAMIREEFGGPVDVIGTSTGGSIALQFGADHPNLVRRLVIHSSAYQLGTAGKAVQLRVRDLARERRWRDAYAELMRLVVPNNPLGSALIAVGSRLGARFASPDDPSDLITVIEAEDQFNLKDRLGEIRVPVLVVAGDNDPFYETELFRETAAGIPNARLVLYPGMGHPASGKQFVRDVRRFLR